jgi:hypothetical protein
MQKTGINEDFAIAYLGNYRIIYNPGYTITDQDQGKYQLEEDYSHYARLATRPVRYYLLF